MNPLHFAARRSSRRQAGVTIVETLVVTSVVGVLTSLAAPAFQGTVERQRLQGAAALLETDIHQARMLAVARNAPLRISFQSSANGSCYVLHTGSANQCGCNADGTPACSGGAVAERVVHFAADGGVGLQANARSVLFDPQRGTVTPTTTVRLIGQRGGAVHQVMNIMGRVRSCSPAPAISGFARC